MKFTATALLLVVLIGGLTAAELPCAVSWIGNSYPGGKQWVAQDVEDIFVDADGTLLTNVPWDEAGGNVQLYKNGLLRQVAFHTHGWGYEGGYAVTANSRYVFIAQQVDNEGGGLKGNSWPAKGLVWSGISRRLRSDISKAAPFPGGHGKEGDVLKEAFLVINEAAEGSRAAIRGLAADKNTLFVSSPMDDAIKLVDVESMQLTGSWKLERPDKLCLDGRGHLWVLQRPASTNADWKALSVSSDGIRPESTIDLGTNVVPADICADKGDRLFIADAGPDQQIKIYSIGEQSPPKITGTLGAKGGIFAPPITGRFGDLRFNRPKGVGVDQSGNVYVASSGSVAGGSTVLESYSPEQKLNWRLMGLTFVDLAAIDPGADTDVYTKEEHFCLDYSKAAGQEWLYRGYTVNPWKYPLDPRIHLSPTHVWVNRVAGRKFLFVSDMTGEFLHVYRFDPGVGETAIPCALFSSRHVTRKAGYPPGQPARGEWIWTDRDGNGSMEPGEYTSNDGKDSQGLPVPDSRGFIWQARRSDVRCLPLTGVSERGVPEWDYTKARVYSIPAELDEVRRIHYVPEADLMFLGGNKGDNKNQHWKPMGPVLCCFENWATGAARTRWQVTLPYEKGSKGHESAEPISFDVAGDYLFVAYTRGLKETGCKYAFVKVLSVRDGSTVGDLIPEKALGEIGLLDIVESTKAFRRKDGEYVVFLEDDFKSKVVMLRWRPT